ncbi:MAG: tetratricopeptide repeat protein [Verrucomicrobiales bacterium]|nr:tetratricopeptide repeat protein [Verrucomicrobiales bacterium]
MRSVAVGLLLVVLTFAAFWPVTRAGFLNYDDHDYVHENPRVLSGLRWENVVWAFTTTLTSNWHPVTWLSHMLDCQVFGARAGWHHAVNLALHAVNAVLLFGLLLRFTPRETLGSDGATPVGAMSERPERIRFWSCAAVAALFAVHPLRVESVAWVSERKDVLSGLFFFLTLWAYGRYALARVGGSEPMAESGLMDTRPKAHGRKGEKEKRGEAAPAPFLPFSSAPFRRFYLLALVFFALGLMSKPMLVTLPFVLLLLDYWPLRRLNFPPLVWQALWPLVREKIPFFALTAASCVVTFLAQRAGGAVQPLEVIPPGARIENALVSYARYLGKTLWPVDLVTPYPHPGDWPLLAVLGSAMLLVVLSVAAVGFGIRRRHLLVGWFWFLGMLVPVIGLVQVGSQAMADRYTYLPQIGLWLALVWSAGELALRGRALAKALAAAGVVVLVACALRTADQARLWRDSGTLFSHAVAVTPHNDIAWANLGNYHIETGQLDQGIDALRRALECARAGDAAASALELPPDLLGDAASSGQKLLRIHPWRTGACAEVLNNLGTAYSRKGRPEAAMQCFRAALELKPDHALVLHNLAVELGDRGRHSEALALLERAVRVRPDHPGIRTELANTLMQLGRTDEALAQYHEALRRAPQDAGARHALGLALSELGRPAEAIPHFEAALRANPGLLEAHNSLGSAWLRVGKFNEAIREFETLLRLMPNHHRAHDNLGVALASLGRLDEAVAHLSEAARLEPNNAGTRFNLGNALAMKGDLNGAVRAYAEALRLAPDLAPAHAHLGTALAELGRREEAISHLKEALRLQPGYTVAIEQLRKLGVSPDVP